MWTLSLSLFVRFLIQGGGEQEEVGRAAHQPAFFRGIADISCQSSPPWLYSSLDPLILFFIMLFFHPIWVAHAILLTMKNNKIVDLDSSPFEQP